MVPPQGACSHCFRASGLYMSGVRALSDLFKVATGLLPGWTLSHLLFMIFTDRMLRHKSRPGGHHVGGGGWRVASLVKWSSWYHYMRTSSIHCNSLPLSVKQVRCGSGPQSGSNVLSWGVMTFPLQVRVSSSTWRCSHCIERSWLRWFI